jgi:sugar phosphate isomerase/epimerase
MLRTGLVSITFRTLTPRQVVDLVQRGGLASIEWGGDVHVPPGDAAQAQAVREMTADAGLAVSVYGSYYRLRDDAEEDHPFAAVLESAVALGAPVIRVWAGNQPSAEVDEVYRAGIVDRSRRIADMAAAEDIGIAYEYHSNTLTDSLGSALALLRDVNHPNVRTFWQPPNGRPPKENLAGLVQVADWVSNIHCFHWWPTSQDRHPLAEGETNWRMYLERIAALPGDRFVSIEFVKDNTPEQFLADAETLKGWIE